jgi:Lrp/AsnC family transcriptional regulator for asnA, asnC and gidA
MTSKIDSLNLKILKDLLSDGRKPFAEIAEENNVSKEVISKRFKQLKAKGVILGFTTQNSVKCYDANFISNLLLHVQRGKLEHIMQAVKKIPNVIQTYSLEVEQDVLTEIIFKNLDELEYIKKLIQRIPEVLGTEVSIWTGFRNHPENLSIFNIEEIVSEKTPEKDDFNRKKADTEIDKVDKDIIDKLSLNGRMPFAEIANPLGVSKETIARRFEKLKQNGDIKVVAQIDPRKIGYYAFAAFLFSFSREALDNNIEKISKTPDVNRITKCAGYQDLRFTLMIRDINHFMEVQKEMVVLPNITRISVSIRKMLNPWPLQREFISTF